MAFCTKCGAQMPDGATLCPSCGAALNAPSQQVDLNKQQTPPPPPPVMPAQPQYQQQQQQYQYQQQYQQPQYQYSAPDPKDHTAEFDPQDISDNKVFAMATYLLSVVGVIIALLASRESKFALFHVRQSLKIQVCMVLCTFFSIIPILGWVATGVCYVILFVVEIISFFNAAGGKAKEAPIVSGLGFLK